MTDRDRLIELHHEAGAEWDYYLDECLNNGEMPSKTYDEFHADHLLANGVMVLPCQKGTVIERNGEKCIANHWNIILTAFNEDNHVRLFDIKEAEERLKELK